MSQEVGLGAVGGSPGEEEMRVVTKKVVVLGHSFDRDLPWVAGTIWEQFLSYRPDLTFLLIGGNDITTQSLPAEITRSIIALAKRIKELTGGEVRISQWNEGQLPEG